VAAFNRILHDLIKHLISKENCDYFRNELEEYNSSNASDFKTGREYLKNQFINENKILTYNSNIDINIENIDEKHILDRLAKSISVNINRKEDIDKIEKDNDYLYMKPKEILNQLEEGKIVVFLSLLVDSFSYSNQIAIDLVESYIFPPKKIDNKIVWRYFRHINQNVSDRSCYERTADACERVRNEYKEIEKRNIAYSYESFISLTRRNKKPICAIYLLFLAYSTIFFCRDIFVKWYFKYVWVHFFVKLSENFPYLSFIIRIFFIHKETNNLIKRAKERNDLERIAEATDLLAQILIIKRDNNALEKCQESQRLHASIGFMNGEIMAERTMGWAYLANSIKNKKDKKNIIDALKCFARASLKSSYFKRVSLLPRVASNLIRIFIYMGILTLPNNIKNIERTISDQELRKAIITLISEENPLECKEEAKIITMYLKQFCSNYHDLNFNSIIKNLNRYKNVKKYPIFL